MTLRIVLTVFFAATCAFAQETEQDSVDRDYSEELPRVPPVEPADVKATFEVQPGFRLDLVASEPLIHDPIAMAFDENSRAYVVEMRGYSEEAEEHVSAIRILEDTDDDGAFDKSTVFLDGLTWPTAIACWDGGVFVGIPPDIFYCKDTDGDGVADIRRLVYTGFSLSNVQGMLNTFLWGFDNKIHGSASSTGADVTCLDRPNDPVVPIHGRDFAFDPRTFVLVPESGGAQHGMAYDDWGRKFVCSNSDHIQLVMFEDRYVQRNPYLAAPGSRISIAADGPAADVFRISPVEPWRILRTRLRVKGIVPGPVEGGGTAAGYFTSATGVTIYRGDAWPAEYRGYAIIGDVGSNLIHRKVLEQDGPRLVARRVDDHTEFVRSKDIWFRPVQYCNGPDGALYVMDMYREVIEHPASLAPVIKKHLDLTSGRDRGRIYRITGEGAPAKPFPRLGVLLTEDLVPLLAHPNAWHRETASRLIYERQDRSIIPSLKTMATTSDSSLGRMHAMYALQGLNALDPGTILKGLKAGDGGVRRHAVRLSEDFLPDNAEIATALAAMAVDDDALVRYQLAFTLGDARGAERDAALAALAKSERGNEWFQLAILSSAYIGAESVFAQLANDAEFRADETARPMLTGLAQQVGATGTENGLRAALASVDEIPESEDALAQACVRSIVQGMKLAGRGERVQAALAVGKRATALLASMIESARADAVNTGLESVVRVDAIQTLAFDSFEHVSAILPTLFDQRQPAEVQSASIAALRRFDEPEVANILLDHWEELSPQLRAQTIEALYSRKPWTVALLDAIEAGTFNTANLDSNRIRALQSHGDDEIRERASQLLAAVQISSRQEVVEQYRDALTLTGDRERGKALFTENCSKCHKLQGVGFEVGPDLSTVAQAGAEKILTNVLDPNREVNPQYVNYTVETNDFESHSGVIGSETATSIVLKRASGETDTILRVNIDSIRSDNLSIMPEGLEQTLDKQALADLIAYLTSIE